MEAIRFSANAKFHAETTKMASQGDGRQIATSERYAAGFAVLIRRPLLDVFLLQAYAQLFGMMSSASVGKSVKIIAMQNRL